MMKKMFKFFFISSLLLVAHAEKKPYGQPISVASGSVFYELYYPLNSYNFDDINSMPTYTFPDHPFRIFQLDSFYDPGTYVSQNYFGRYVTYFLAPETGEYQFHLICRGKCLFQTSTRTCATLPKTKHQTVVNQYDYTSPLTTKAISMIRNMRYCLEVYHRGTKERSDGLVGLGVTYPNGSQLNPIRGEHVFFTAAMLSKFTCIAHFYKTSLKHVQDLWNLPAYQSDTPDGAGTYTNLASPKGQSNNGGFGQVLTTRMNFKPGTYKFHFRHCKEECALEIGGNRIGESSDDQRHRVYTVSQNHWSIVKVYHVSRGSKEDEMTLQLYENNQWVDIYFPKVRYPTNDIFTAVKVTPVTSTSLYVTITPPYIRPSHLFTYQNFTVHYRRVDGPTSVVTGIADMYVNFTNLNEYTDYQVWVHYEGSGMIVSSLIYTMKTLEDIPSAPPDLVLAEMRSSTAIEVSFGTVPSEDQNGVITDYVIQYAKTLENGTVIGNWSSQNTPTSPQYISNLKFWTFYGFRIAAVTSVGTGPFSNHVVAQTDEDVPTLAPATVTGFNTSETSIIVLWGEVLEDGRSGIITKYIVKYHKDGDNTPLSKEIFAPQANVEINSLEWFTDYYVAVAAYTRIGRGPFSETVIIKTDEWKPQVAPPNVRGNNQSDTSILIHFDPIPLSQVYGFLLYSVAYYHAVDRPDKDNGIAYGTLDAIVINNLNEFDNYSVQVTLATRRGEGLKSDPIYVMTDEGVPALPPRNIRTSSHSSSVLVLWWDTIPKDDRNGIILSYKIKYREYDTTRPWETEIVPKTSTLGKLTLRNLKPYRHYDVMIAGMTKKGVGNFSIPGQLDTDPNLFRTAEDVPNGYVTNLQVSTVNKNTINATWDEVPEPGRLGIITKYKVEYNDMTLPTPKWRSKNVNAKFRFLVITNLKYFTNYSVRVTAATKEGFGNYSKAAVNRTGEAPPAVYPSNFTCMNSSSSAIYCSWGPTFSGHGFSNGIVLGYHLFYSVVDCLVAELIDCNSTAETTVSVIQNSGVPIFHVTLDNLEYYVNYSVQIQLYNSIEEGYRTPPMYIYTDDDIPSATPAQLQVFSGTTTSILIYWDALPFGTKHGKILGYNVYHRRMNEGPTPDELKAKVEGRKSKRKRRSAEESDYIVLTRHYIPHRHEDDHIPAGVYLYPEEVITVNHTTFAIDISGLAQHEWYTVRVAAFTIKDEGPYATANVSCTQRVPSFGPNVTVYDLYSLNEIEITWNPLEYWNSHGTVFEYNIIYYPVKINDVDLPPFDWIKKSIWVEYPIHGLVLRGLTPFVTYAVQVAAFNYAGLGAYSAPVYADTCRCEQTITTSYRNYLPLFSLDKPTGQQSGMMANLVANAAVHCCQSCVNGHGKAVVNYTTDHSGQKSLKRTVNELKIAASEGTNLVFPIQNSADAERYFNNPYIPIVFSPGIAIYSSRLDHIKLTSAMVEKTVQLLWSFILLIVLICVSSGVVMWTIQCNPMQLNRTNRDEYPDDIRRGAGAGVWWAMSTMLRLGDGAVAVGNTRLARFYAMIFIIFGVVLTSILISSVTSIFITYCFTITQSKMYSQTVVTLNGSYDSNLVLKWGSRVAAHATDSAGLLAVLGSGKVNRVAVDAVYSLYHSEEFVKDDNAVFRGIKESDSSYGVVLSGQAKRLEKCMRRYINDERFAVAKKTAEIIDNAELVFAADERQKKLEVLGTYKAVQWMLTIKVCGGLLLGFILVGLIFECRRRRHNKIHVNQLVHTPCYRLYEKQSYEMISDFQMKCTRVINQLELKHAYERLDMKKNLRKTIKFLTPDQVNKYRF